MMRGARASSKSAPPRGLLSIAASANRSPNLQVECDTRCNFYHQARFLPNPARFFLLSPALTELAAVATDDGAAVDDGSPMGAVLALTAANSTPGECLSVARYRFLHHSAVSFVSSDIRVFGRSQQHYRTVLTLSLPLWP